MDEERLAALENKVAALELRSKGRRQLSYPADQPVPPRLYGSYSDLKKTFFGDMI